MWSGPQQRRASTPSPESSRTATARNGPSQGTRSSASARRPRQRHRLRRRLLPHRPPHLRQLPRRRHRPHQQPLQRPPPRRPQRPPPRQLQRPPRRRTLRQRWMRAWLPPWQRQQRARLRPRPPQRRPHGFDSCLLFSQKSRTSRARFPAGSPSCLSAWRWASL